MDALEFAAEAGLVLGHGQTLESLNATVVEIARTDIPVLILGESGTGKEVYARLLHRLSARSDAPLKKMICSTLDQVLFLRQFPSNTHTVSEAHIGGTLFLDGIEELDLT